MLKITILLLGLFWCLRLWIEGRDAAKSRATLRHVVHVNGTRGKSTVCRLIEAGLRAGGLRVFCKTTGTDPMTIDVSGNEEPLHRRGKANIKEQVGHSVPCCRPECGSSGDRVHGIAARISKMCAASHFAGRCGRDYERAARSCRCDGG